MAIFRVMRAGGTAIFGSGVVVAPPVEPPVEPPAEVVRSLFRPMRGIGGAALFGNALPDRNFTDSLTAVLRFSYEGENFLVYADQLTAVIGFRFAPEATFELVEVLETLIAFSYDLEVQAKVSDTLEALTKFDYEARGRIRGWNPDSGPKAVDWTPDPKPNLF